MNINTTHTGDCLKLFKGISNNSIDLIVTSPPYNKGYWSKNRNLKNGFHTKSRRIEYGVYSDKVEPVIYAENQKNVIRECLRVLKDTGSLFYNHTDILHEHQTKHPLWVYEFPVKQIIFWNRRNTPRLDKSYFFPITEYIYWIQKTSLSRVYFDRHKALFQTNIWSFSPDVKNSHPAPFPVELPLNCIKACCPANGIVLDPYMGSGTTARAAQQAGVNYIGFEIEPVK